MDKEGDFTRNEVAALVENLRADFRVVAEVVLPLRDDMIEVKERLSAVEIEVRSLKDVVAVAIPDLTRRVGRLESLKR